MCSCRGSGCSSPARAGSPARLAQSLGLWERTGGVIEAVRQSKLFVGLAQLVSEMQGKDTDPVVQSTIAELICYAQTLEMSLDYACRNFQTTASGMVHPNVLAINTAEVFLRLQSSTRWCAICTTSAAD